MNLTPCVCGHLEDSHDAAGCIVCAAQSKECIGYWTQAELNDAIQTALVKIVKATRNKPDHEPRSNL